MSAAATLHPLSSDSNEAIDNQIIQQHDRALTELLDKQITDPDNPGFGAYPDQWRLYHCYAAANILENAVAAYVHPKSTYYHDADVKQRISWAIEFLHRNQAPNGTIDLVTTNFDSPPDTGFVVHQVATAATLARLFQKQDIEDWIKPFLIKAGGALAVGGVHTPNHRWVICAALAQTHDLYPSPKYLKRIDEWLSEGIDIDEEGQFYERSTTIYNAVCNNTLVTASHKLNRPELLEPVRKNLDSMLYLLHPNFEVVTELSKRQDINTRGDMKRYWFALRYMAIHDNNGQYAAIANQLEPGQIRLPLLMEYPILQKPLPEATPLPQEYIKHFPLSEITHIRRGKISATILHKENSRWFSLINGNAVINAVRFASAFYGKGQFNPERFERNGNAYHFSQQLNASYYQPVKNPSFIPVTRDTMGRAKQSREQSNISTIKYETTIVDKGDSFELHISATGTDNVPLAIEINLRKGGKLEGAIPAPNVTDAFLFRDEHVLFSLSGDTIQIGPGINQHAYTQVRGSLTKLSGPSLYLTGYTPFKHIIKLDLL